MFFFSSDDLTLLDGLHKLNKYLSSCEGVENLKCKMLKCWCENIMCLYLYIAPEILSLPDVSVSVERVRKERGCQ